jgi:RsiW-degrading membrane proteinase PrsW (M82 family)
LIVWPLRPKDWGYFRVLTFISLVSPPAILYAIPVEKWDLDAANSINSLFLLIVALWRVALLVFFLRRSGELDPLSIIVATFLPLTMIVIGLSMLNLEQAVFNFMGGLRDRTPNDSAFGIVMLLSLISFLLFIPLVIGYAVMVAVNTAHARQQRLLKELDDNH